MLLDQQTMFSDAQVVTATGNSTNAIDAGAALNLGAGYRLRLNLNISAVSGTTPTLSVALVGADDVGFATNKITIMSVTPTIAAAMAQANLHFPVPPSHTPKRFYRLEFTVGGTTPSMVISSGFVIDEQTNPAPPIT